MENKIITTKSGLQYQDIIIGTGNSPEKGDKVWVLGMFERGTKDFRAIYVPDRSEKTLTSVIL